MKGRREEMGIRGELRWRVEGKGWREREKRGGGKEGWRDRV